MLDFEAFVDPTLSCDLSINFHYDAPLDFSRGSDADLIKIAKAKTDKSLLKWFGANLGKTRKLKTTKRLNKAYKKIKKNKIRKGFEASQSELEDTFLEV